MPRPHSGQRRALAVADSPNFPARVLLLLLLIQGRVRSRPVRNSRLLKFLSRAR